MRRSAIPIICFLIVTATSGLAQPTTKFFNYYNTPAPQYDGYFKVCTLNDGYLVPDIRITPGGDADLHYFKTDLLGNIIWDIWENDANNIKQVENYIQDGDDFVFLGLYDSLPNVKIRGLAVKIDSVGNKLWERHYEDSVGEMSFFSGIKTFDNSYILAGYGQSNKLYGSIYKIDSIGNTLYSIQYFHNNRNTGFFGLVELPNHNVMLTGFAELTIDSSKLILLEIDPLGNVVFDSTYSFNNRTGQMGLDIQLTADNNLVVSGYSNDFTPFQGRGLIVKFDYSGNILWNANVTEFSDGSGVPYITSEVYKIKAKNDSTFICAGNILLETNQPPNPKYKLCYLKYDNDGNELWRRYYTHDSLISTFPEGLDLTPDGGFISGAFERGPSNYNGILIKANCMGYIDSPIAGFSHTVNNLTATFDVTSSYFEYCTLYFGDGDSAIYTYQDTVPIVHNYLTGGVQSAYMIAYACGESDTVYIPVITGIDELDGPRTLMVNPNPSTGTINIPVELMQTDLLIYDLSGRLVYQINHLCQTSIDLETLPKGCYVLQIRTEEGLYNARWVKM